MLFLLFACGTQATEPTLPQNPYAPTEAPARTYPPTRGGVCTRLADCGCADVRCYQTLADEIFNTPEVAACILTYDCKTLCTTQEAQTCVSSSLKKNKTP